MIADAQSSPLLASADLPQHQPIRRPVHRAGIQAALVALPVPHSSIFAWETGPRGRNGNGVSEAEVNVERRPTTKQLLPTAGATTSAQLKSGSGPTIARW